MGFIQSVEGHKTKNDLSFLSKKEGGLPFTFRLQLQQQLLLSLQPEARLPCRVEPASLHNSVNQFINQSLSLHISLGMKMTMNINMNMNIYPIDSVSLENPDW